ncbi:hypothetical protein [Simonsiella muelleri]|uniref:hypothetical protein n=1 Tax=Simonsiella muelleri TaxID=72 RepID=UPI0028D8D5F2|nr:hypothetical protein [Simonsiella muelleri]
MKFRSLKSPICPIMKMNRHYWHYSAKLMKNINKLSYRSPKWRSSSHKKSPTKWQGVWGALARLGRMARCSQSALCHIVPCGWLVALQFIFVVWLGRRI